MKETDNSELVSNYFICFCRSKHWFELHIVMWNKICALVIQCPAYLIRRQGMEIFVLMKLLVFGTSPWFIQWSVIKWDIKERVWKREFTKNTVCEQLVVFEIIIIFHLIVKLDAFPFSMSIKSLKDFMHYLMTNFQQWKRFRCFTNWQESKEGT